MGKYIKEFQTHAEYEAYAADTENFITPNVSYCVDTFNEVHYSPFEYDYSNDYLTFKILENTTIRLTGADTVGFYYSTDNGETWTNLTRDLTSGVQFNAGTKVLWKRTFDSSSKNLSFSGTGSFEVCGNIMSMAYGDDFRGKTSLEGKNSVFYSMFSYFYNVIKSIEHLILPATTLSNNCYEYMFSNATAITKAPDLIATNVNTYAYHGMFQYCSSLLETPAICATTFGSQACLNMFNGCSALTETAAMVVNSAGGQSFENMYANCSGITDASNVVINYAGGYQQCSGMFCYCNALTTKVPVLNAMSVGDNAYSSMFFACKGLKKTPELPATTLGSASYSMMFNYCTALETSSTLPASTLTKSCYYSMFYGCTSLTYIKILATNISANRCLDGWVGDVAASGTFVKKSSTSFPSGENGIPEGWTVENV